MQSSEAWASVTSTNAIQPRRVSSETLSKIWKIYHATAKRNLYDTTKINYRGPNTPLPHNIVTNDQMLR